MSYFSMGEGNRQHHATRVAIRVRAGSAEEFLSEMRGKVIPEIEKQIGVRRAYLLRSRNGDGGSDYVLFTLWNSKRDADEYGSSGVRDGHMQIIQNYTEAEPVINEYDVEYHVVNAADLPPPATLEQRSEAARKEALTPRRSTRRRRRAAARVKSNAGHAARGKRGRRRRRTSLRPKRSSKRRGR
jgi:heme-degrading monooxygenase HmoA